MCKQDLDGDKNNPKISSASVTNFHLTLAWAKENFPILTGDIDFFLKSPTLLYNSSFNTHPAFFQQINMALNDRSHKMWPQIRILSSMKRWDLGMGR